MKTCAQIGESHHPSCKKVRMPPSCAFLPEVVSIHRPPAYETGALATELSGTLHSHSRARLRVLIVWYCSCPIYLPRSRYARLDAGQAAVTRRVGRRSGRRQPATQPASPARIRPLLALLKPAACVKKHSIEGSAVARVGTSGVKQTQRATATVHATIQYEGRMFTERLHGTRTYQRVHDL